MADLNILNSFEIEAQGTTHTGKQGSADDDADDPFAVSVTGVVVSKIGSLATATARTVWDEDAEQPTDFDFLHFWADQDCFIQLISQATNVVFPVEAKVPFALSGNTLLAAANTTAVSGSAPSVEAIDSIVIQNNSGNTMNYRLFLVD